METKSEFLFYLQTLSAQYKYERKFALLIFSFLYSSPPSFSTPFSFVKEEKKEEFFSIFISFLKRRRGGNRMERGREGEEGGRIKYFSSLEKERGRKKEAIYKSICVL
jgi:hypothetical protein